jgi:long-subunit acyl-CoA synthetase (AMP-forming)
MDLLRVSRSLGEARAGLAARGIHRGDRVAILARNSHGFAALRYALMRLGAVMVPINFMLQPEDVGFILTHSGARATAAWRTSLGRLPRSRRMSANSCGCRQRRRASRSKA